LNLARENGHKNIISELTKVTQPEATVIMTKIFEV
jgi:hypothetical protein